jgi:hypothetical protein
MTHEAGSLSEQIHKLKAENPAEREQAVRRVTEAYTPQLLRIIRAKLGRGLADGLDPEDVLQSVFARLDRGALCANRNAFFAWLRTVALNRTENARRWNFSEKRDVRREARQGPASGSGSRQNVLDEGHRVPRPSLPGPSGKRPYGLEPDGPRAVEPDSFFGLGTIEQLAYGIGPEGGARIRELYESLCQRLPEHDNGRRDCLHVIFCLTRNRIPPAEIGRKIGRSKRTVERKLELVSTILHDILRASVI